MGAEPGVDPRRVTAEATYSHMINPCRIEVVDYSAIRNIHSSMSKDEFIDFMDTGSLEPPQKPSWAKVRWINICGLSWDVIKAVSIAYGALFVPMYIVDFFFYLRDRSSSFGPRRCVPWPFSNSFQGRLLHPASLSSSSMSPTC